MAAERLVVPPSDTEKLKKLVQDKVAGKSIESSHENELLDKFSEKHRWDFKELLQSLEPEAQVELLQMLGQERLLKLIDSSYTFNEKLEILAPSAQSCLIELLGDEFIRKNMSHHSTLIDTLCLLQRDDRLQLLQTLGVKEVAAKFALPSFLIETIDKLKTEDRNDVVADLLQTLSGETLLLIEQSRNNYHRFEPWQGRYDQTAWITFVGELEKNFLQDGYNHVLLVSDGGLNQTISISYSTRDGWAVVNPHSPAPFAITSKDTAEVAAKIFSVFATEGEIKLSTQFCVRQDLLENDSYYKFREKHQAIGDQLVLDILPKLSADGLKDLLRDAFNANNRKLCEKLIETGVDFFACNIDGSAKATLFNALCEAQAKFNIQELKKEIFTKDWQLKWGGKIIESVYYSSVKVPATVALEWKEILAAECMQKSYHSAWEKIINLRQKAACSNTSSLFRQDPAKEHYASAHTTSFVPLVRPQ